MEESKGFYDNQIKMLCNNCSRLLIVLINSVFNRTHSLEAEIIFLDKEQNTEFDNPHYMDMFLQIETAVYHLEFQLVAGNMAIRMYEYAVKETIREAHTTGETGGGEYELVVTLPDQAVIFLAGNNKSDHIRVIIMAPDGRELSYTIPCVSASDRVQSLSDRGMYILIPFQQVQLNSKINDIKHRSEKTKKRIADELISYHHDVITELMRLERNGIITSSEGMELEKCFRNVERYLAEKDDTVRTEVDQMGDTGYIAWSDRLVNQGIEQGIDKGDELRLIRQVCKKVMRGIRLEEIADQLEEDLAHISIIVEATEKCAPDYNAEHIYKELHREQKAMSV